MKFSVVSKKPSKIILKFYDEVDTDWEVKLFQLIDMYCLTDCMLIIDLSEIDEPTDNIISALNFIQRQIESENPRETKIINLNNHCYETLLANHAENVTLQKAEDNGTYSAFP
ncbi:hypothetical protein J3998_11595 [Thiomicrorhabdus sp. 6S2-11]|uniref:STAS domain-containing protein n=1 Tax=Thiomicrorhabdus marina TaxID=2818442 RepID=A0ABS3Q785_9GAMM|nr:hypothetical protein [Thiomicrorhabdus marina]MBO1928219.1 hypothetical protein [Thiomicrorhabdus marina]